MNFKQFSEIASSLLFLSVSKYYISQSLYCSILIYVSSFVAIVSHSQIVL